MYKNILILERVYAHDNQTNATFVESLDQIEDDDIRNRIQKEIESDNSRDVYVHDRGYFSHNFSVQKLPITVEHIIYAFNDGYD